MLSVEYHSNTVSFIPIACNYLIAQQMHSHDRQRFRGTRPHSVVAAPIRRRFSCRIVFLAVQRFDHAERPQRYAASFATASQHSLPLLIVYALLLLLMMMLMMMVVWMVAMMMVILGRTPTTTVLLLMMVFGWRMRRRLGGCRTKRHLHPDVGTANVELSTVGRQSVRS